jgi:hypothetical protein
VYNWKVQSHLHAIDLNLFALYAIPSVFKANGIKQTSKMSILPIKWVHLSTMCTLSFLIFSSSRCWCLQRAAATSCSSRSTASCAQPRVAPSTPKRYSRSVAPLPYLHRRRVPECGCPSAARAHVGVGRRRSRGRGGGRGRGPHLLSWGGAWEEHHVEECCAIGAMSCHSRWWGACAQMSQCTLPPRCPMHGNIRAYGVHVTWVSVPRREAPCTREKTDERKVAVGHFRHPPAWAHMSV